MAGFPGCCIPKALSLSPAHVMLGIAEEVSVVAVRMVPKRETSNRLDIIVVSVVVLDVETTECGGLHRFRARKAGEGGGEACVGKCGIEEAAVWKPPWP
jgi:hypothetical protein